MKTVTASRGAESKDESLAGLYTTTANLNMRDGAGKSNKVLVVLPKGTKNVRCYGWHTVVDGVKWLYVRVTHKGVVYTGFCSSKYLKR